MILLLILLGAVIFIILSTTRLHLHPILALLGAALGYGLLSGLSLEDLITAINEGFGGTISKVGIIILAGVMIGTFLEKSGGVQAMAQAVLKVIGEKLVIPAISFMGYIVSIPVFGDSGFIVLLPLTKALAKRVNISLAGPVVALALGLTASHTMVPPTPGPIAAAGILEADIGTVILMGLLVSGISLSACIAFAYYVGKRMDIPVILEDADKNVWDLAHARPPAWKAFLPILIPIILILGKSIAEYPTAPFGEGDLKNIITFIGNPMIALLLGFIISWTLPKKFDAQLLSGTGWLGQGLQDAAVIIIITGAGGAFGNVIQQSALTDVLKESLSDIRIGIFLPFLLAAVIKTAQGSSTVALITTASIMVPLLSPLGLDTGIYKALTVLAIGAGSAVFSHANDSFFWIFTQMTGLSVAQGYRLQSLGTFILGGTAISVIFIISLLI